MRSVILAGVMKVEKAYNKILQKQFGGIKKRPTREMKRRKKNLKCWRYAIKLKKSNSYFIVFHFSFLPKRGQTVIVQKLSCLIFT